MGRGTVLGFSLGHTGATADKARPHSDDCRAFGLDKRMPVPGSGTPHCQDIANPLGRFCATLGHIATVFATFFRALPPPPSVTHNPPPPPLPGGLQAPPPPPPPPLQSNRQVLRGSINCFLQKHLWATFGALPLGSQMPRSPTLPMLQSVAAPRSPLPNPRPNTLAAPQNQQHSGAARYPANLVTPPLHPPFPGRSKIVVPAPRLLNFQCRCAPGDPFFSWAVASCHLSLAKCQVYLPTN